jgi:hypothetical protein
MTWSIGTFEGHADDVKQLVGEVGATSEDKGQLEAAKAFIAQEIDRLGSPGVRVKASGYGSVNGSLHIEIAAIYVAPRVVEPETVDVTPSDVGELPPVLTTEPEKEPA